MSNIPSARTDGVSPTATESARASTEQPVRLSEVERYYAFVRDAERALAGRLASERVHSSAVRDEIERVTTQLSAAEHELSEIKRSRAYHLGLQARRLAVATRQLRTALLNTVRDRPPADVQASTDTDTARPTVSVIMPVYNKGATLMDSVRSVELQTMPTWELIVWDDGSTDAGTIGALEELEGQQRVGVRIFRAANQGVVGARNAAIAEAHGHYICHLDPDDLIEPTYLEKAVLFLETHQEAAFAYPWQESFDGSDGRWTVGDTHPKVLSQQNSVPICAVVRSEAIAAVGAFNSAMGDGCEDWELWANLCAHGYRGRVIPEFLFKYRYSESDGRDAEARPLFDEHRRRIMRLHPELGDYQLDAPPAWRALGRMAIQGQPWQLPTGHLRPVVFFVPWLTYEGGAETFLRTLARRLVAEGRTVVFVATIGTPPSSVDGKPAMAAITPYIYDLTTFITPDLWLDFVRSILWRLHRPVVVNVGSSWLYEHIEEVRAASRGPARVLDVLFNHIGHMPANIIAQGQIDHTVVVHSMLERLLVEHFKVSGEVSTIPVGITPFEMSSTPDSASDLPTVTWLGRMSSEKRPNWFIEIARRLRGLANFVMAGVGPLQEDIARQAETVPGLSYLGMVPDVAELLGRSDWLVNTSEIEGISVVAMEALSLGVPVVATDVGGMRDLLVDGRNGYLVDARNWNDMADLIESILASKESQDVREAVRGSRLDPIFTTDSMVAEWERALS
jgi:glycosyltransferase involved in cell wall biosynthesis/GT2 family glycosyltransferase